MEKEKPKIVQAGEPVLRARASEVPAEQLGTPELSALVDRMVETMRAAPGVGLAAPQIGVGLRVIVLEDAEALMAKLSADDRAARGRVALPLQVIVNPVLRVVGDERALFFEGCLSVEGYMALVERHSAVEVSGVDPRGVEVRWEARGWPARILQHEVDHLDGTLYVDRMLSRSLCANETYAATWMNRPIAEIRAALGA